MSKEAAMPPVGLMDDKKPETRTRPSLRRSRHPPPSGDDSYRGRSWGGRDFAYLEMHSYNKSPHDVAPKATLFAYIAESNIEVLTQVGNHEAFKDREFPGKRPEEVVEILEHALNTSGILYKTHGLIKEKDVHLLSFYNTNTKALEAVVERMR